MRVVGFHYFKTIALLAVLLCLTPGCYFRRLTENYHAAEELVDELDDSKAVLDVTGISVEEQDRRLEEALIPYKNEKMVFTINAGDVLYVRVYGHPDVANEKIVVTPDGYLGMMLAGQVKVGGLTLDEATAVVEEKLSEYITNPKVGLSPDAIHSETATITGAVGHGGIFVLNNDMRLADLYALAGGSSVRNYDGQWLDAAVLENAIFVRDGQTLPVNFSRAIKKGDALHNIKMRKGDYIYVPAKDDNFVYVIGDVVTPQKRIWNETMGLLELLAACGWVRETYWHHAIIIRGGFANPRMYKVDLGSILAGRKRNVRLLANDIVYLPKDDISEFNVFIRKLMPTFQLIQTIKTTF